MFTRRSRQRTSHQAFDTLEPRQLMAGDTTPPRLLSSGANINLKTLVLTFSEDVSASLATATPQLRNRATGEVLPASRYSLQWFGNGSNTAVYTVNGTMANGTWDFVIPAAQVRDAAGNAMSSNASSTMAMLAGDATQDFRVNFDDLLVLAANYNQPGRNFQTGNFDYSTNGRVDFSDLLILAANYNTTLPPAVANVAAPTPGDASHFSDDPIGDSLLASDDRLA